MTVATFDTYAAAKALREAGFDEAQAEAAVTMVRDAVTGGVATKADLAALETRLTGRFYGALLVMTAVMHDRRHGRLHQALTGRTARTGTAPSGLFPPARLRYTPPLAGRGTGGRRCLGPIARRSPTNTSTR